MSKMSEIAMELDDQAFELGFESREEALEKGYTIDYSKDGWRLVPDINKAHGEWLKEKESLLKEMRERAETYKQHGYNYDLSLIERAIDFIEKGEV